MSLPKKHQIINQMVQIGSTDKIISVCKIIHALLIGNFVTKIE